MSGRLRRLLLLWAGLMALLALELGASFLPIGRAWRPLVMLPALPMAVLVGFGFMEVRRGPTVIRLFAAAAIFWLAILLGLGSLDPLTRTDYPTAQRHQG